MLLMLKSVTHLSRSCFRRVGKIIKFNFNPHITSILCDLVLLFRRTQVIYSFQCFKRIKRRKKKQIITREIYLHSKYIIYNIETDYKFRKKGHWFFCLNGKGILGLHVLKSPFLKAAGVSSTKQVFSI